MKFVLGLLTVHAVIFSYALLAHGEDAATPIIGIVANEVTLSCPNHAQQDHVVWRDSVWNTDRDPIVIWDSQKGKNVEHGNIAAHSVDEATGDLTVSRLTTDDAGIYMCEVETENGNKTVQEYDLTIASLPTCTGDGDTTEGTYVPLACTYQFSGTGYPDVTWKNNRGAVDSMDESTIFEGRVTAGVTASYLDDEDSYECVMELRYPGKVAKKSCQVPFTVKYSARNATVEPDQDAYSPGDTITFSALGNPAPNATLTPGGTVNEDGSISVTITTEMQDQNFTYTYTAENALSAEPVSLTKSFMVTQTESSSGKAESQMVLVGAALVTVISGVLNYS